jgi:hypothetical protein
MSKTHQKLNGMIIQYLSNKSLEAIKKDVDWNDAEANGDPEALWKLVILMHKVLSASEVDQIIKLSA